MAVPRHHMAKGKQLRRRSHLALKPKTFTGCTHCGKQIMPHAACKFCGYYKGRQVLDILGKELRKQQKKTQQTAAH